MGVRPRNIASVREMLLRFDTIKGKYSLSLSIYMKAKRNIKAGDHLHSGVYFYDDFKVFVKRESFCCS
jgi:hypothetical protein